jgi:hypothetical protein
MRSDIWFISSKLVGAGIEMANETPNNTAQAQGGRIVIGQYTNEP